MIRRVGIGRLVIVALVVGAGCMLAAGDAGGDPVAEEGASGIRAGRDVRATAEAGGTAVIHTGPGTVNINITLPPEDLARTVREIIKDYRQRHEEPDNIFPACGEDRGGGKGLWDVCFRAMGCKPAGDPAWTVCVISVTNEASEIRRVALQLKEIAHTSSQPTFSGGRRVATLTLYPNTPKVVEVLFSTFHQHLPASVILEAEVGKHISRSVAVSLP